VTFIEFLHHHPFLTGLAMILVAQSIYNVAHAIWKAREPQHKCRACRSTPCGCSYRHRIGDLRDAAQQALRVIETCGCDGYPEQAKTMTIKHLQEVIK
jgi:hypothetical protein